MHFLPLFPSLPAASSPRTSQDGGQTSSVAEKRLMEVKLGELGTWLGGRDYSPNGIVSMFRRAHTRYYNKYIGVKKGGIGGIAMLLAGYVVISYVWSYDHLKHDRWRKHH